MINTAISMGVNTAFLPRGTFLVDKPISINGARNLKIVGNGTRLIFTTATIMQKRHYEIIVAKSTNLTFQDIVIDMDPLPFTQGFINYK